jgi:hypothetical protein
MELNKPPARTNGIASLHVNPTAMRDDPADHPFLGLLDVPREVLCVTSAHTYQPSQRTSSL